MITSYKLNGLFKCSKFDSLINFQCQYPHCQSLEGVGGGIIPGRQIFQIFPSEGRDYLREAINRGTAVIQGNTVG